MWGVWGCEGVGSTWEGLQFGENPSWYQEPIVVFFGQRGLDAHFHGPPAAKVAQCRRRGEGQARGGRGRLVQPPTHGQARRPVAALPLVLDEEQDVRQGKGGLALAAGQQILLQGRVEGRVMTRPGQPDPGGAGAVAVDAAVSF